MSAGSVRNGQLVDAEHAAPGRPGTDGSGGRQPGPQARWEARDSVDLTGGNRTDHASSDAALLVDGGASPGAVVSPDAAPPPSLRDPHPVLGAALRPPLTGPGQPPRPLVGDALRDALASHPAPPPPAPPTDRYAAPEGYAAPEDDAAPSFFVSEQAPDVRDAPSPYSTGPGPYATGELTYSGDRTPYAEVAYSTGELPYEQGVPTPAVPPSPGAVLPGLEATGVAVPGLAPGLAALTGAQAVLDPAEQELWFQPRVEPTAGATGEFESSEYQPEPYRTGGFAPGGDMPVAGSSSDDPSSAPRPMSADPATVAITLPLVAPPEAPLPEPAGGSPVEARVRPLSRRARRAAEHEPPAAGAFAQACEPTAAFAPPASFEPPPSFGSPAGTGSESPDPADSEDWVELPSYARPGSAAIDHTPPPALRLPAAPEIAPPTVAPVVPVASVPAPAGPVGPSSPDGLSLGGGDADRRADGVPAPQRVPTPTLQPAEPTSRARAPRPEDDETGVRTTASIPVIRPPVQVRRPDEHDRSATAETRSLRVTPPSAKALFSTPVGAKGADGHGAEGWSAPAPAAPAAVNVAPPSPALAPPHPVAPKVAVSGSPAPEVAEPGATRKVVVIPSMGGNAAGRTPSAASPAPPAVAPPVSAPPPVVPAPAAEPVVAPQSMVAPDAAPPVPAPAPAAAAPAPYATTQHATTQPAAVPGAGSPAAARPDLPPQLLGAPGAPAPWGSDPDPGMSEWLGELRGGGDPGQRGGFGFVPEASIAETVVPGRGRGQSRTSGQRGKRTEGSPAEHFQAPQTYEGDRGRWLSMLVFWAPALILLMLAGVVIWLVR